MGKKFYYFLIVNLVNILDILTTFYLLKFKNYTEVNFFYLWNMNFFLIYKFLFVVMFTYIWYVKKIDNLFYIVWALVLWFCVINNFLLF